MSETDFDKLLLEAVDEGLSSIGESSKHAIYIHLERSYNVKRNEIPSKIGDFASAIERIFGSGAEFVETLIMKNLHKKADHTVHLQEPKDSKLAEYIVTTRRSLVGKKKA